MLQWGEIKRRLGTLDVSSLADADKQLRVMDAAVKPLNPGLKLIGRARTVKCHEDFLAVITAIHDALADEVIVVDSQQSRTAVAGELLAMEALRRELSGAGTGGRLADHAHRYHPRHREQAVVPRRQLQEQ